MGFKEAGLRGSLRNVSVGASVIPDSVVYDFDADSLGESNPGPWSDVRGDGQVDDSRANSTPNSYYLTSSGGKGSTLAETATFEPNQYEDTFGFAYNETVDNGATVMTFITSSGDPILYVGPDNPQVRAEGATSVTLEDTPSPEYDTWREFEVSFNWTNTDANITWTDIGGSTATRSQTIGLASAATYDIEQIRIVAGSGSDHWGGQLNQDCWIDDTVVVSV